MAPAALLAMALAASGPAPERPFRTSFDAGNALELSAGGAWGDDVPVPGDATDLRLRLRWRRDLRTRAGDLEWLREMHLLDGRILHASSARERRAATVLAWRGVFVRHRASPFLLVPGPRLRLPFPFDVGLLVEAGGLSWDSARPRDLWLAPLRSALLLDLGARAGLRRLAFGPELAWTVRTTDGARAVHGLVPFTGGVVDARAESTDGLLAADLAVRGGSSLSVPGGARAFVEARLAVERVVVAVNDVPLALYAEGALRGGASGRGGSAAAGVRAGFWR